jgi:hypothetical protein
LKAWKRRSGSAGASAAGFGLVGAGEDVGAVPAACRVVVVDDLNAVADGAARQVLARDLDGGYEKVAVGAAEDGVLGEGADGVGAASEAEEVDVGDAPRVRRRDVTPLLNILWAQGYARTSAGMSRVAVCAMIDDS